MANVLTDKEIDRLIQMQKPLPSDYTKKLALKGSGVNKHAKLEIQVSSQHKFLIILRQQTLNKEDFSAILGYVYPNTNTVIRLRRYNGFHQHRNKIEDKKLLDYHIHQATERYQVRGGDAEGYALETDRYSDLKGALKCLIEDCNFTIDSQSQTELL